MTIAAVANPIGSAVGLVFPPAIVAFSGVTVLLVVDAAVAISLLVVMFVLVRAKPDVPPSFSALEQERIHQTGEADGGAEELRITLWEGVRRIVTDFQFLLVFVCYGLNVAVLQAVATLAAQILTPFGYDSLEAGVMSAAVVVSGVLGSAVLGWLMDAFHVYKQALLMCFACTAYFTLLLVMVIDPGRYGGAG